MTREEAVAVLKATEKMVEGTSDLSEACRIACADMAEKLNPHAVCKYLEQTGWNKFPLKRTDVKIYQMMVGDNLFQVNVPLDRELHDFKTTMYDTVNRIAECENKSVEQVMLYLLNPNTSGAALRDKPHDDAIPLIEEACRIACEDMEKQIPKKPKITVRNGWCGNCGTAWGRRRIEDESLCGYAYFQFCPLCGQAIDWSEA